MYFYQRLRDLREDNDRSQSEIAEILNTSREQYSRWESGKRELPVHNFIALARYYSVSLDYLAGLVSEPRKLECTEPYMCYYKRLRELRKNNGKSQSEISEILNTLQEQYSRWENGKRELPMHHFITLARYYNVSLDYLAGLISEPRKLR